VAVGGALIGPGPVFGLLSGLSWGAGDFCGGLLSRYASVVAAILTSQVVGLGLSAILLGWTGEASPPADAFVWAAISGASGIVGLGFFYLALARGTMGVVAPLAALIGAGLPVLVAIVGGEAVSLVRLGGIGLALLAVVLISLPGGEKASGERRLIAIDVRELPLAVTAGLGFAGFFIGLDRASASGALWWPLVVVRVVGVAVVIGILVALVARTTAGGGSVRARMASVLGIDRLRADGRSIASVLPLFVLTGIGDMGGNAFFVLAREVDAFSVAVVLSSLYPVVTTVFAALFLRERLRRIQVAGVALATISVPLLR
jgi:drug/metabolite transporter (DMT)-like permease